MMVKYRVGGVSKSRAGASSRSALSQLSLSDGVGEVCVCGGSLSQVAGKADCLVCLSCSRGWVVAGLEDWRK